MKNVRMTICLMVAVLFMAAGQGFGLTQYKDGATHSINSPVTTDVWVDYQSPGIGTTLNVLSGASQSSPYWLTEYENAKVNVSGGSINRIECYGNSSLSVSGTGSVSTINTYNNSSLNVRGTGQAGIYARGGSHVNVSGGSLSNLYTYDNSVVEISGGSISSSPYFMGASYTTWSAGTITGFLHVESEAILTIRGTGFAVDGAPVGFGELSSILGTGGFEPARRLTGVLQNGQVINNDFYLYHTSSKIVLTPEPATFLLLGLGGFLLSKRRR
jgi:hypothetical protein